MRNLYAQHNRISSLGESLRPLSDLRALIVSDNEIHTLAGSLRWCSRLQLLDAARNKITNVDPENDLPRSLRHLVLAGNAWAMLEPKYRALLQDALPHLSSLDGFDLETGEEVMPSAAAGEAAAKLLMETDEDVVADEQAAATAAAEAAGADKGVARVRVSGTAGLADDAESFFRRLRHRASCANPFAATAVDSATIDAASGRAGAPTSVSGTIDAGRIQAEMAALRERRTARLQAEVEAVTAQAAELTAARGSADAEEATLSAVGAVHGRAEAAMQRSRERMVRARAEHAQRMTTLQREHAGAGGGGEAEEGKDVDDE